MARDYLEVVKFIEAMVPQSVGGTNQDDTLRARLVQFANVTIDEIDREQRWSLSYAEPFFTTTAGVTSYALPYPTPASQTSLTSTLFIKRVYYTDFNGRPVQLKRMEQYEAQRLYSESQGLGSLATTPPRGKPKMYFLSPNSSVQGAIAIGFPQMYLQLYPTPDDTGPETSGNFKIRVAGYWKTPAIVETLAGITATSQTLTFTTAASGNYLISSGVQLDGTDYGGYVSVRGAGSPTGVLAPSGTQVADNLITGWTALVANTATTGAAAGTTVTAAQTFFYSRNWIIQHFPKLLICGMMREIGEYYGNDQMFGIWQGRFQEQLGKLREFEFDRARSMEMMAAAQVGQTASSQRRQDGSAMYDVRGGGWSDV